MFDLVEEVLHHSFGKFQAIGSQQAENNEVTIPAVHLIELAAGHKVGVRKIQQPRLRDFVQLHIVGIADDLRQALDADSAALDQFLKGRQACEVRREIQIRLVPGFLVRIRFTLVERAGEMVPAYGDVLLDVVEVLQFIFHGMGGKSSRSTRRIIRNIGPSHWPSHWEEKKSENQQEPSADRKRLGSDTM